MAALLPAIGPGAPHRLATLALGALLLVGCQAAATLAPATPTATPGATASEAPTSNPTPSEAATATLPAAAGPCDPNMLAARITDWQGAAGHRIASVELTNKGSGDCTLAALSQPQLVDGNGAVLIDSAPPGASTTLTVGPGGVLHTLVQDGNYCGPAPVAPVTVAFVFAPGLGRIVAAPLSATDTSGIPPCNGAPGSAGDIEMQPWAP